MFLEQIGAYWTSRAEGYYDSIHAQIASGAGEVWRAVLKEHAPGGAGLRCLDVGCGPGLFSALLAQEGHQVTAVDYAQGMLKKARETCAALGVTVQLQQGDAQSLPFADGSFDYIVSRNLVWNLEQPDNAYREWKRLLRPGGRLLVADANHYLHYFDEGYRAAAQVCAAPSAHAHMKGVDPTPINEIARRLPLSREKRPGWDTDMLLSLGFECINMQVARKQYTHPETGETRSLVYDFILSAALPAAEMAQQQAG